LFVLTEMISLALETMVLVGVNAGMVTVLLDEIVITGLTVALIVVLAEFDAAEA
jgi:hypothetical protein